MQTENDKKDNKRDRQSLEEDKSVVSGSPPPKRHKSEGELVARDVSNHLTPLSPIECNETKDDKKRTGSVFECDDLIDNNQPSYKRHKVVKKEATVIPEQPLATGDIEQRINLLELFLKQRDYFLYFPKKTAYKFTALSKPLMKRYIELAEKYKEIDREKKKLTFELDLMSDLESFNEEAKRARIDREEVCLIFKTPQLDKKEYDPNRKKIMVPTSHIHLSSRWKNIKISFYCMTQIWQTDIKTIKIFHNGEINVLTIESDIQDGSPKTQKYGRSITFCLSGMKKINIIERDVCHRVFFQDVNCSNDVKYRLNRYCNSGRISLADDKNNIISIRAYELDSFAKWKIMQPLQTFRGLEHLELEDPSDLVNDKFPLSLKYVEFSAESSYRHIMNLYNDGMVLDHIQLRFVDYISAQTFMDKCPTKSLTLTGGFSMEGDVNDLPDDFKIILPKTLEQCAFANWCVDYDGVPLNNPFLDFSRTNLKSMMIELNMVLTLPLKCADVCLFIKNYKIDNGDEIMIDEEIRVFEPNPEIIAKWIWPTNMERLEIESSKYFNYNPHVPKSLKRVIITNMDGVPDFPSTLSNITLKTTIKKNTEIDFKLFPDIFINIIINVANADIFQGIGHLTNLKKLSVRIKKPKQDKIVFQCPPGLQELYVMMDKESSAEIQILPNKVLGCVVYGNIAVIMDRELYKGIFRKV